MNDRLLDRLGRLGEPRILVMGDLMVDRYVWGDVDRISQEAPIPVLHAHTESDRPGGAGNVVLNLRALGARALPCGLVGDDADGAFLRVRLDPEGAGGIVADPGRPTIRKTRMIARNHQILRVDREDPAPAGGVIAAELLDRALDLVEGADLVILSDYAKGVLTREALAAVIGRARGRGIPVIVDPKGRDYSRYRGANVLTPNLPEAEAASGQSGPDASAARIMEGLDLDGLVITLGKDGIALYRKGFDPFVSPTRARSVFDVSGAGDTVIAVLGLALASGIDLADAVGLANVAAGIVVGKFGAAVTTRREMADDLSGHGLSSSGKVKTVDELEAILAGCRDKRIVFTNGCFDILHLGHVRLLEFAAAQGDILVVGLNADESVRRLKGAGRPFVAEAERAEVLAALAAVDYVVLFGEDTPRELIAALRPRVIVKGEDWRGREVVGADLVTAEGGSVAFAPLVPGRSTSGIAEKIRGG